MTEEEKNEIKKEFEILRIIMFKVVQGSTNEFRAKEPWLATSHSLGLKLFRHISTVSRLTEPAEELLPDIPFPNEFIDFSTAQVVTRAALETLLIFSFIFNTDSTEQSKFNFQIWALSGLFDRQKLIPLNDNERAIIASERKDIDLLIGEISKSSFLSQFTGKQQNQILNGNWVSLRKWGDLASKAGFDKDRFDLHYSYLCGHSHSSFISSMQISQARDMTSMSALAFSCTIECAIVLAFFIKSFSNISHTASDYLAANPTDSALVQKWIEIYK